MLRSWELTYIDPKAVAAAMGCKTQWRQKGGKITENGGFSSRRVYAKIGISWRITTRTGFSRRM